MFGCLFLRQGLRVPGFKATAAHGTNQIAVCAWEMAQLVKCSLHTHGELGADLQHVELQQHVRHQQWLQSRNWVGRERDGSLKHTGQPA